MAKIPYSSTEADRGHRLLIQRDYATAEAALRNAVDAAQDDFLSLRRLTYCLYYREKHEDARQFGRRTLEETDRFSITNFEAHANTYRLDLSGAERPLNADDPTRNVISYSLWGDNDLYCLGAIENVKRAKSLYPGWTNRFYCARDVPKKITDRLRELDAQVLFVDGGNAGFDRLFWRFMVSDDPNVERFLCRDCDSIVNSQEQAAVEAWLTSGQPFHVMRDHLVHVELMLAGMWGGVAGVLPKIFGTLPTPIYLKSNSAGADQDFLRDIVWPLIKPHTLVHDSTYHPEFGDDFPAAGRLKRPDHIGMRWR